MSSTYCFNDTFINDSIDCTNILLNVQRCITTNNNISQFNQNGITIFFNAAMDYGITYNFIECCEISNIQFFFSRIENIEFVEISIVLSSVIHFHIHLIQQNL
jgi:hypothetical protein